MSPATPAAIASESTFISMMMGTPRCRSSTSRRRGTPNPCPRNANSPPGPWNRHAASTRGQLGCGPRRDGPGRVGRAVEQVVVNHHRHAVGRQVHVELEAVGARAKAGLEGRQRVFGRERAAAAMREHARTPATEERHGGHASKGAASNRHAGGACSQHSVNCPPFGRAAAIGSTVCPFPRRSPRWAISAAPSSAARFVTATCTKRCATT